MGESIGWSVCRSIDEDEAIIWPRVTEQGLLRTAGGSFWSSARERPGISPARKVSMATITHLAILSRFTVDLLSLLVRFDFSAFTIAATWSRTGYKILA